MKKFTNAILALSLCIAFTHTPHAHASALSSFANFAATAPLKHPIAFAVGGIIALAAPTYIAKAFNLITLASLWALTTKTTLSPLWAFAAAPLCIGIESGVSCYNHTMTPNGGELRYKAAKPSFRRSARMFARVTLNGGGVAHLIFTLPGLGCAYLASKVLGEK